MQIDIHVYLFISNFNLQAESDEALVGDDRGKVLLSIRYNTSASQLHVAVVRCAALSLPYNREGLADPYVKL